MGVLRYISYIDISNAYSYGDPVEIEDFRRIIKKVATNTNSKEIFDIYEKQQRKLKNNKC